MALPESYTLKVSAIPAYFDTMLDAQPPERFSVKFIENLGFTSTNDRLFIGILKDLGLLNRDGAPQSRYFDFLDKSRSRQVLAEGIREAFGDLFAINVKANDLSVEEVKNKLRTLYAGKKTPLVIGNIAKTFKALCDYADFTAAKSLSIENESKPTEVQKPKPANAAERSESAGASQQEKANVLPSKLTISGLQYHVNIVLPDTRDQAVYDAIFKSLRDHLV
jgi:hypothetical protein